jgi:hypothetical protein
LYSSDISYVVQLKNSGSVVQTGLTDAHKGRISDKHKFRPMLPPLARRGPLSPVFDRAFSAETQIERDEEVGTAWTMLAVKERETREKKPKAECQSQAERQARRSKVGLRIPHFLFCQSAKTYFCHSCARAATIAGRRSKLCAVQT